MSRIHAFVALALLVCACGGSSPAPGEIHLSASGLSPGTVTISSGGTVRFVNDDAAPHQITSTACSALDSPELATGQEFRATLTGPKSCAFSDALNPNNTAFKGTVSVAAPGSGGGGSGY